MTRYDERLQYIELVAYWRGVVCRPDVVARFGVSGVQASTDLNRYIDMHPGALSYDLRRKRYIWTDKKKPFFGPHRWADAVAALVPASQVASVATLGMPLPAAAMPVHRAVISGLLNRQEVGLVVGTAAEVVALVPTAIFCDGWRWHVRGYDCLGEAWRAIALREVSAIQSVRSLEMIIPEDADWAMPIVVAAGLNHNLSEDVADDVRRRIGLAPGEDLRWPTTRAMEPHVREWLSSLGDASGPWFSMKT